MPITRTKTFADGVTRTYTVTHLHPDGTEFDPADLVIDDSTEAGRRALDIIYLITKNIIERKAAEEQKTG